MEENYFVGTYSNNGIYKLKFDMSTFTTLSVQKEIENCSYLCSTPDKLYGIIEIPDNLKHNISYAFSTEHDFSNTHFSPVQGKSPCYISLDKTHQLIYVANYKDGSLDVFSLDKNKNISNLIYHKDYTSHSHIHYVSSILDDKFLIVTDLGDDTIFIYKIIFEENIFNLETVSSYKFAKGTGPRHLVKKDKKIYVLTENTCELYEFSLLQNMKLQLNTKLSLIPKDEEKLQNDTGCAIKLSSDKNFIYTSLRGHNIISVFDITQDSIKCIQNISCHGITPRDISFSMSEGFLFCANQNSDNISIFSRDKKTGYLQFKSTYPIKSPACIILRYLSRINNNILPSYSFHHMS